MTGYIYKMNHYKGFVIADNIADAFDKVEKAHPNQHFEMGTVSINVLEK